MCYILRDVMKIITTKTISEQITEILKERIISSQLKPGTRIDIATLVEEFGTSRTPIRDALNRLIAKGLVEVSPRVGFYVKYLSVEEIEEICELRKLIEIHALTKAIIEDTDQKYLKTLLEKVKESGRQYTASQSRVLFDETDRELHVWIVKSSGNRYIEKTFNEIFDLVNLIRHTHQRVLPSVEEHINIIQSLLQKNLEEAVKALEYHLDQVKAWSIKAMGSGEEDHLRQEKTSRRFQGATG